MREKGGASLHNFSGIHWYRHAWFASLLEHKQGELNLTTVIISEKDEFTRLGLISVLQSNEDIGILGDYEADEIMLSDLVGLSPDVVILGGTENILDRCRTCQEVRTLCPTAKVLTLSEKHEDDDLYEIILSGASGDVLKSAGSAEMVKSVGVVACGGLNFDNEALIRLLGRVPRQQGAQPSDFHELSKRDHTIITMVAQGYSNSEIGMNLNLSKFTIRNIVGKLRIKLGVNSRAELAAIAARYDLATFVEQ